MKVDRISVITVCLNARDSIRLTLDSVKRQSFQVDHIIVDGNSTDDTLDIVREYKIAKLVSEKDKGIYDAMDKARTLATGDAAIFLNAGDTFYDNDVCKDVAAFFERTKADIVFGNLMPVYLRATDKHDHAAFTPGQLVDGSGLRDLSQLYDTSIHHQMTFYRTELLRKVTFACPTPSGTGEYNLLLAAIMQQRAKVKFMPRTISRFALGGTSTRDITQEWPKFAEARDALRRIYFGDKRPFHGRDFFVYETLIDRVKRMKPKLRVREMVRNSRIFNLYTRVLRSVAYRATTEAAAPLGVILDRKVGPLYQHAHKIERHVEKLEQHGEKLERHVEKLEQDIAAHSVHQTALLGQVLSRLSQKGGFTTAGFGVFSQFDEDGRIDYLVSRLAGIPQFFVEIGVGDYREANTRFLLEQRNWRGVVVECRTEDIKRLMHSTLYWKYGVTAIEAMVNRDNVDELVSRHAPNKEIGILSIDVDGIDYWLWDAIKSISPWIVIAEYNGIFGPDAAITVPYRPDFDRTKAHYSWLFNGASISALRHLAEQKGYTLIGVNNARNNSFFVRNDVIAASGIASEPFEFRLPNFREARARDGSLSLLYLEEAVRLIADLQVVDVRTGKASTVGEVVSIPKSAVG